MPATATDSATALAPAPDAPPVFELRGISKSYPMGEETVHALREVDVEIFEGEFVAILGPSGSGKSTLMHIMGFMDQPTSSKILLDGADVSRAGSGKRAPSAAKRSASSSRRSTCCRA
ncbi:MAG: ATP-binding cassette domain-containing protein [Verrucomicrobiales bacterium]